MSRIDQIITTEQHASSLGQAYALLHQGNLTQAKLEFEALLRVNADDAAASTGLEEVQRLQTTDELNSLRRQIEEREREKDYAKAIVLYNEVLAINPDLQFAKEGKRIQEQLMTSHASLDFILNDPDRLSLNREFELAHLQLDKAREIAAHDPELNEKVERVSEILELMDQEVPLIILSDNTMEIRLTNVGDLEPFERLELNVRPGRYVVQGSRFGCRDIRKTVIVKQDMDPITIVCEDPI